MRIYIKLSKNEKIIPFNYQELLTGVIHKWIGKDNKIHGKSGHYSFSWIQNTIANKKGINLNEDAYFFIGTYEESLLKQIIKGVLEDPNMFHGVKVIDVQIKNIPNFNSSEKFLMASPVLLKMKEGNKSKHVTIEDANFEEVLTDSFKNKLNKANLLSDGVSIRLNPETSFRQTKLVTYKGIMNKTSLAPIIIEGTPEQIAFAWCVGLGNSTGIGFGTLK